MQRKAEIQEKQNVVGDLKKQQQQKQPAVVNVKDKGNKPTEH